MIVVPVDFENKIEFLYLHLSIEHGFDELKSFSRFENLLLRLKLSFLNQVEVKLVVYQADEEVDLRDYDEDHGSRRLSQVRKEQAFEDHERGRKWCSKLVGYDQVRAGDVVMSRLVLLHYAAKLLRCDVMGHVVEIYCYCVVLVEFDRLDTDLDKFQDMIVFTLS